MSTSSYGPGGGAFRILMPPASAAELHQGSLVLQEPALAVDPATEARQLPARPDDAMAGDDDRNRIPPVSGADGPRGAWVAEAACQRAGAQGRRVRNRTARVPQPPLEGGGPP